MSAVEKYVDNKDDVKVMWRYKVDELDSFFECEIVIWFSTATEITMTISWLTYRCSHDKRTTIRQIHWKWISKKAKYVLQDIELAKLDTSNCDCLTPTSIQKWLVLVPSSRKLTFFANRASFFNSVRSILIVDKLSTHSFLKLLSTLMHGRAKSTILQAKQSFFLKQNHI